MMCEQNLAGDVATAPRLKIGEGAEHGTKRGWGSLPGKLVQSRRVRKGAESLLAQYVNAEFRGSIYDYINL